MNYEDYKVEELEDESVKKSNIAKTVGIGAGMGVIGAGAAVAATSLTDDDEEAPVSEDTDITSDDVIKGAKQGVHNTTVNGGHNGGDEPRDEHSLTADQTVSVVDEEGNVVGSQTAGTLDGKAYVATDYDGDGMADEIYYDLNGDGIFSPNEGATLHGAEQFSMTDLGQATHTTVYVQGNEGSSEEGPGTNGESGHTGETEGGDGQFTVDQNLTIVDEEGNVLASQTAGTLEGKVYVATDYDGDGLADELYYDVNGDGELTPDEGGVLDGSDQFAMSSLGQATYTTVYVQGSGEGTGEEPLPGEGEVIPDDTDIDGLDGGEDGQLDEGGEIEGDLADNNGGEDGLLDEGGEGEGDLADNTGDYADNNEDYNNNEDVSDFA